MAPTQGKRKSLRAKSQASSKPTTTTPAYTGPAIDTPFASFRTTKKDKREMKHSLLLSKIQKAAPGKKRRRPNKKLVTTLESLADALPDAAEDGDDANGSGPDDRKTQLGGQATIRHRSLKSRPGAMKRKGKLERLEMDRFGRNMALMAAGSGQAQPQASVQTQDGAAGAAPADRWKALRGFIEGTMERKKEFVVG